jgi:muramoyltetrapeptide carboxypeptidase
MIVPEYLQKGDTVGVVATAKKVHKAHTLRGIELLKSWGLYVLVGEYVFAGHQQFAGTDEQRTQDFQAMIDNENVKAVFMVRGGYGTTRIIDQIDFSGLNKFPKWVCGFSDITAIHAHLFRMGIASIHAPMPSFFYALEKQPLNWLRDLIFGKKQTLEVSRHPLNRNGKINGNLVGGNLSLICHTIGTASEIITKGNILFLEDVGEQLYNLDRMMVQLKRAGFLTNLAGLVVGQFTAMKDDDPFGQDAHEIVKEHVKDFPYPVAFNFPIGHSNMNHAVPIGVACKLDINDDRSLSGTILAQIRQSARPG